VGNGYEILLAVVIVGGIGVQGGRRIIAAAGDGAVPPHAATLGWLLVALTVLLAGLALRGLAAIGPLVAGPATRTWVLSAPVDRAGLLFPRHCWALVAGAGAGLAYGVPLGLVGGSGPIDLWLCTALGSLLGLALIGWSVRRQSGRARWLGGFANTAIGGGLVLGMAVAGLGLVGIAPPAVGFPGWLVPVMAICAGAGIAGGSGVRGRISRAALSDGAGLAGATRVAVSWFDPTLLTGVLTERRRLRVASVRSTRLRPGSRARVLLGAELRRLSRSRSAILTWAALLVVPYALAAVVPPVWVPVAQLVAATVAADRLAGGLRTVSRSASIRRILGGSDRQVKLLHLVMPGCGALIWSALSLPSVHTAALLGVLYPTIGATLVIYRMATCRPMDYHLAGTLDPEVL
jgi:hypothetical protein